MIPTFEKQTVELNEFEKSLIPKFVNGFQNKIGPGKAITNREILKRFNNAAINDARVRKIVQYIRLNQGVNNWFGDKILIANSKGYFITNHAPTIESWIESLQSRINAIQAIKTATQTALSKHKDKNPQLKF